MSSKSGRVEQPARTPAWALIIGCACTVLLCVLVDVRLGLITSMRGLVQREFTQHPRIGRGSLLNEESSKIPAGSVKTLSDLLDLKQLPHPLLAHSDMEFCPNVTEPKTEELDRVPKEVKMLMLIGTMKTGTTWLFEALNEHPSFVSASRLPGGIHVPEGSLLAKEPRFFNRWPLPPIAQYLKAWKPAEVREMQAGTACHRVLLDASPQYLMSAMAPPRIQAAVPHAKFIMVIRDAPSRTFSEYKMRIDIPQCKENPSRVCPLPSFFRQVDYELNDPRWQPECYFNGSGMPVTWWDCHRCHFGFINQTQSRGACEDLKHSGPPEFRDCSRPSHRFIDQGLYAPQLAWWLRFFPPERFLIISSWQLRDEVERIKVLNRILDFAGLSGAQPFTADIVDEIAGLKGTYSRELAPDDKAALGLLREYFRKPQQDLVRLVHTFWPDDDFHIEYES